MERLSEDQDRERRTIAQEQGIVFSPGEYSTFISQTPDTFKDPKFSNGLHPNFDK